MRLLTIGYEGLGMEEFYAILVANGAQTIVDVREVPMSRKPGFGKQALLRSSQEHGLVYIHLGILGCPKTIRQDYRCDEDWARYTGRYLAYLATQESVVLALSQRVSTETCCLLCYEADVNFCHRLYVAQHLAKLIGSRLVIEHLSKSRPVEAARPAA